MQSANRFCALVLLGLVSQHICASDLLDIYQHAKKNDPAFSAAQHTLEAVQQKKPQALAGLLPTLGASGNSTNTRMDTSYNHAPSESRDVNSWTWTLQLTQPLFRLQNVFAYDESTALVEQAQAQFAQAEQDLMLRTAQAYFDVVVAEDSIAVADAQVNAMAEQHAIAERGFKNGTAANTDVYEAKAKLGLAHAQRVAALNDCAAKQAALEKIIGETAEGLSVLQPAVVTPAPEPNNPEAWIEQAKINNPAVRAQHAALLAAGAEVKKNRAEHLPTVDVAGSYGNNYSSGNLSTPSDYSTEGNTKAVWLQVNMPLYSGGGTQARVKEAIANRYKAQDELEAARRQSASNAKEAFAGITNGLAQIDALQSAVQSGEFAVKGNDAGYKLGTRINSDVLNAKQQLYTSQRDLIKARYDTLLQGLKLKAAAGVLSEADLAMINGLLVARR